MTQDRSTHNHGVHRTVYRLTESLRSYIEAQYHVRNEGLIRERRLLLEEPGAVSQVPFVESTPVYEVGAPYAALDLPQPVKDCLNQLAALEVGIYAKPYVHQSTALEAFFTRAADVIVATGTGSGKTESFFMPIIGQLALEAERNPQALRQQPRFGNHIGTPTVARPLCELYRAYALSWTALIRSRHRAYRTAL